MLINHLLPLFIAYIIGSVPTAIWVGKLLRGIDIREFGSGNAGATNAFRVLGWKPGLFVLLTDMAKGFLPVYYLPLLFPLENYGEFYPLLIGIATILGHIFTLFAGFRGGKGVGTTAGVFAAIIPWSLISALLIFGVTLKVTNYVSLSSILAAVSVVVTLPLFRFFGCQPLDTRVLAIITAVCLLIIYRHKNNIRRLINGTENKITER